jgi:arsenite methyltransferase
MTKTIDPLPAVSSSCCGGNPVNVASTSATPIRESVREYYAAQARSGTSCCGPSNTLYPVELIGDVPGEVANFSLGCGDPITAAALQSGETVLDLGSGGGLDCFLSAKQVGETGHVIGVDMTPEMLERARASAVRMGIQNVEFREGYLESLPVEDNSVDVVISNCVINLSPDKPQVFREIFRALKPGGRLAVSDTVTNGPLPEELKKDMQAWGACVAGALDVSEYVTDLIEAGFSDVTVKPKDGSGNELKNMPVERVFSAIVTATKPARAGGK